MKTFLTTGHRAACTLDPETCRCAIRRNLIAGVSTFSSSVVTGVVGYFTSLAVLSDAPHSLGDFSGYFLAAGVLYFSGAKPSHRAHVITGKILAVLLFLSVLLIGHEAWERLWLPAYQVQPRFAILGATYGVIANAFCWYILSRDKEGGRINDGLIGHAKSDTYHQLVVFTMLAVAIVLGSAIGPWLPKLDLGLTFLLMLYMTILSIYMWQGRHLHLPVRKTLKRIFGRASATHHHEGDCAHHH